MRRTIRTAVLSLSCVGLALAGPAQTPAPTSEAERLYREGWWLSTGQAEHARALELFQRAALADGPAAVRGRALLQAALELKQLGRAVEAVAALQRAATDYAGDGELMVQVQEKLGEWTPVDLSQSFAAWYARQRASPEFQARVQQAVEGLASAARETVEQSRGQLLAWGDAAVPALRQAALGVPPLSSRALDVLVDLGELPPLAALLASTEWTTRADAWRVVLGRGAALRAEFARDTQGAHEWQGVALATAVAGPSALLEFVAAPKALLDEVQDPGSVGEVAAALIEALHARPEPEVQAGLMALSRRDEAPMVVRRAIERVAAERGWRSADAAGWLEWGRGALSMEARTAAVHGAARALTAADGTVLDQLLEQTAELSEDLNRDLLGAARDGLLANPQPTRLPWSAARVRAWIEAAMVRGQEMGGVFARTWSQPEMSALVAEAVLTEPAALQRLSEEHVGLRAQMLAGEDDAELVLAPKWAAVVAAAAARHWPQWSVADRVAFVGFAQGALFPGEMRPRAVAEFLRTKLADQSEDASVREAISAWLES